MYIHLVNPVLLAALVGYLLLLYLLFRFHCAELYS